jgi:hypothetical protein
LCRPGGGPTHIKVVVEWDHHLRSRLITDVPMDPPQEHESVALLKQSTIQPDEVRLEECFQLYTSEERLGSSDAWYCPNCRTHQQGTVKRLSLWTLPEILVIHLKRFKQVEESVFPVLFPCLSVSYSMLSGQPSLHSVLAFPSVVP